MKRLTMGVMLLVSGGLFSQIPKSLMSNHDSNLSLIENIKKKNDSIMDLPDSSELHLKKKISRWNARVFPYLTVSDNGNKLSNESFTNHMKYFYSTSNLHCGGNDLANWESNGPMKIGGNVQAQGWVNAIYVNPLDLDEMLAGTRTSGIFRSTNGGQNWTCVTDNLSFPVLGVSKMRGAPNNPDRIIATTGIGVISGNAIYSDDGGISWFQSNQEIENARDVEYHPTIDGLAFVVSKHKVYYTLDYGENYTEMNFNPAIGLPDSEYDQFHYINTVGSKVFVTRLREYSDDIDVLEFDFNVSGSTMNYTFTGSVESKFTQGSLKFIDFSNAVGNRIIVQRREANTSNQLLESTDGGATFTNLNIHTSIDSYPSSKFDYAIGGYHGNYYKNELLLSPSTPNVIYWGSVSYMERFEYDVNNNVNLSFVYGQGGNSGHHADYRSSQIVNIGNQTDYLIFGNDGGVGYIPDGNQSNVRIHSGNGDLNNSLIHAFDYDEKTQTTVLAFQDNAMRIWYSDNTYSNSFIHEGSLAFINRLNPEAVIGENAYYSIRDKWNSPRDLVDESQTPGDKRLKLGGIYKKYRYYPDRFVRGLDKSNAVNKLYGGVLVNKGQYDFVENDVTSTDRLGVHAVGICERNPNVLYASIDASPSDNFSSHLYKSVNEGDTWQPVSSTINDGNNTPLTSIVYNRIRSIAVDADDSDHLIIGFDKVYTEFDQNWDIVTVDEKKRVFISDDGGSTFTDYSEGLPAFPVEYLIWVESTDDLMFCATSVGVYYRNKNMSRWECFSKNLPKTQITGMKFNYCEHSLMVSTYGRGMWKTDVPFYSPKVGITEITGVNNTWSDEAFIADEVIVKNGAQLTINSTIQFAKDASIQVEPGGELIIQDAHLTTGCNTFWKGIYVHGTTNQSQYTSNNHGKVDMDNSTIENAYYGIQNWKEDDWNATGGIIQATNSEFVNCRKALFFWPYLNTFPSTGNTTLDFSVVKGNKFTWNNDYMGSNGGSHIQLFGVKINQISGNTFIDESENNRHGTGIITLDAYANISPSIPIGTPDFHEYNGNLNNNRFINLRYGINLLDANSERIANVDNNYFSNCIYSTNVSEVNNAILTRNFYTSQLQSFQFQSQFGISTDHSSAYTIEGNTFEDNASFPNLKGIMIENSGFDPNQVYRNYLVHNHDALISKLNNRNEFNDELRSKGLQFLCNTVNSSYNSDINIFGDLGEPLPQGARIRQGNPTNIAGNLPSTGALNQSSGVATANLANTYYYSPIDPSLSNYLLPSIQGPISQIVIGYNPNCDSKLTQEDGVIVWIKERSSLISSFESLNSEYNQLLQDFQNGQAGDNAEDQLQEMNAQLSSLSSKIIKSILLDPNGLNIEMLNDWIKNHNGHYKTLYLIDLAISTGDKSKAQSMLIDLNNEIANETNTAVKEILTDFYNFKTEMLTLTDNNGILRGLTPANEAIIRGYAEEAKGIAKIQAQNILCFFLNECKDPEFNEGKSISTNSENSIGTDEEGRATIHPNPSSGRVYVTLTDDMLDKNLTVNIMTVEGKVVNSQTVNTKQAIFELDKLDSGIYFVTFLNGEELLDTQKLIIQ